MNVPTEQARIAHAKSHVKHLVENSPLYGHLFSKIGIVSASAGSVTVRLELEPYHLNSKDSLHGAVTATLVDFVGGLAIACYDMRPNTGVSTDMHISFVGGAKTGETLEATGNVDKCGGSLAFTRVTVRKAAQVGEGDVVAVGSHTKFVRTK